MDIKLPLACVLLIGGAIGLVFPREDTLGEPSGQSTEDGGTQQDSFAPAPRLALAQDTASSGWAEGVVLERESDGHFYADIEVDGYPIRMLVDTGASVVALSADDALALGMQWYENEVQHVAQGAGGPVSGVHTTIARMHMGDHEARDVRAVIISEGANISLLGQSFLSTLGKVEITGDRMVLGS